MAPAHQSRHGARIARKHRRLAAASAAASLGGPMNSSLTGSHFKDRCNVCEMIARCPNDAER